MTSRFQPEANPSIVQTQAARVPGRAYVLVNGNEKGGSGKSTTALHIAIALMADGARVATLDLDARQGTLSRYIENRAAYVRRRGASTCRSRFMLPWQPRPTRATKKNDPKMRSSRCSPPSTS